MKTILKLAILSLGILIACEIQAETRVINLKVENCQVVIDPVTNNGCDQNQCAGNKDCVCVDVNDEIEWKLPANSKRLFKFKFNRGNPLKNCGEKFTKQKKRCPMKKTLRRGEVFDYAIKLKKCDGMTDPRIVIK